MPDRPVFMIFARIRHCVSGLSLSGVCVLGAILLPVPVSGQEGKQDLESINNEIRDRQSRRLGLEEKAETIQNQSKNSENQK